MDCEHIQAHFPDHLAGRLRAADAEQVAAHLRTCTGCAAEFDALEQTWQTLGDLPGYRADSIGMRARFDATLAGLQHGAAPKRIRWTSLSFYGRQFAAAAALLIVGVFIGRQTAPAAPVDPQIASLRDELRDMRQTVTLSLLQQQSASERLKGVSYTSQIEQPGMEITAALLDTLMHDPNDNVRLSTVDALKRFADYDMVRRGAVEALSRQTSPLVQLALVELVVEVGGSDAAGALRRMSRDPMVDEVVRARAAQALTELGA